MNTHDDTDPHDISDPEPDELSPDDEAQTNEFLEEEPDEAWEEPEHAAFDLREGLFFDSRKLPQEEPCYVAWLDVMGTESTMSQSLLRSTNYIAKLHVAILAHAHKGIRVIPMMDGAYVVSRWQGAILHFLRTVFEELANNFVVTKQNQYRFLVRCGLSYGNVVRGARIPTSANKLLGSFKKTEYRRNLVFGMPLSQAFATERLAAPYGIAVHESACNFAPHGDYPLGHHWWRWFHDLEIKYFDQFRKTLFEYMAWCRANAFALKYPPDRIDVHSRMADEYFRADEL